MFRHIVYFTILLGVTNAIVHKFFAQYRLTNEAARIRQNALERRRFQEIREFYHQNELPPSMTQTFVAEVDLWYSSDLCIISSSANLSSVADGLPEKHTYDPSESSSFVDLNKNFTDWGCGDGKNGSDKVTIDTVSANVIMGVVDDIGSEFKYYPIDAVLGLNPNIPKTNTDNLVSQLVAGLDKPIMTWWQNVSIYNEGTAQLTLGGEDANNCQSSYTYVPQLCDEFGYGDFRVHLASGSIDGMPNYVKKFNKSLEVWRGNRRNYCDDDFFYLMTDASNATWNETIDDWEVDCDVTKAKNITLNIGSDGNTADGKTKQLVMTGADYIQYIPQYDTCIVYANHYKYVRIMELRSRFLNNHCVAYNAKEKTIGFADVK